MAIPTDGGGNRISLVLALDLAQFGVQFIDRDGRPAGELRTGRLDLAIGVAQRLECRGLNGHDLLISRAELPRGRAVSRFRAEGHPVGRQGAGQQEPTFEGFNNRPDLPTAPVATKMRETWKPACRRSRTGPGSSGHEIGSIGHAPTQRCD